ncbi:MAG: carbohydrate binding domain-containing protein [Bacteroidota bacterium]
MKTNRMVLFTQLKSITPVNFRLASSGKFMCRKGMTLFLGLLMAFASGVHAQSLVGNGNFEGGHSNVWEHNKWGNVGLELTTYSTEETPADVVAGTKAFKAEVGSLGTDKSSFNSISNRFQLKPNTTYYYSFYAKASDADATLEFYVSSLTDGVILFEPKTLTQGYVNYQGQFTTPAQLADQYYVVFYYPDITTYWLDEVTLYEEEPISGLAATSGNNAVNLSWPPAVGATSVKLFSKPEGGDFAEVLTGTLDETSSRAFFNNLSNETPYSFYLDIEGGPFEGQSNEFTIIPSAAWDISLVPNPSFENAGTLDEWATSVFDENASATFSQDNTDAAQGTKSMKVEVIEPSPLGAYVINANPETFDLFSELDYTLSFWAKANFSGAKFEAWVKSVDLKDGSGNDLFLFYESFDLTSEWKEYRIPFSTAEAVLGEFRAGFHFVNKGTYHLDNVRVTGPVTDFTGIAQNGEARLRWTPAAGAQTVRLFRQDGGGIFEEILSGSLDASTDRIDVPNLDNGSEYTFYLEVEGGPFDGTSQQISLVPSASSDESLIINGGFEREESVGGDPDAFEAWQSNIWEGAANYTIETTDPASGNKALQVDVTTLPPGGNFFSINSYSNSFELLPETEYRFAFWAKASLPGSRLVAQVARNRETPSTPVNVLLNKEVFLTTEWALYEETFTTRDTVKAAQLFNAVMNYGGTRAVFQLDNVTLEGPVSSLEAIPGDQRVTVRWRPVSGFFDLALQEQEGGGTSREIFADQLDETTQYVISKNLQNGVPYRYQLDVSGGPFSGLSNEVRAVPGPNLILNSGFEFNLLNWDPILDTRFGPQATIFEVATGTFEGNRAVQAQVNVLGSDLRAINMGSNLFKISEGNEYTLSFWARGNQNGNQISVLLESEDFQTALGNKTYFLTTDWELYHVNFTPEALTDSMFKLIVQFESTGTVWLDEFYVGTPEEDAFCEGGTVAMPSGATDRVVCGQPGVTELVRFDSLNADADNFIYLLTDTSNVILERITGDFKNFGQDAPSDTRIYGVAFSGELTADIGESIGGITATRCIDLSTNYISVARRQPQAGEVQLMIGGNVSSDSLQNFCVTSQNNVDLNASFGNTASSETGFTYLVTDVSNIILALTDENSLSYEADYPNTVRVWGLSYGGSLEASVGQQADIGNLSSSCFELSSNFITLTRDSVEGGTLGTSLASSSVFACRQDTSGANVQLFTTSGSNTYTYVVTDTSNSILATDTSAFLDFSNLGVGMSRVWGLSYAGNLQINSGEDIISSILADGCYELSENFITVVLDSVSGGSISLDASADLDSVVNDTVFACPDGDLAGTFQLDNANALSESYAYLLTDENDRLLVAIPEEIPAEVTASLNQVEAGEYRIWGVAYSGELSTTVGLDLERDRVSSGCFEVSSNFIRLEVDSAVCPVDTSVNDSLPVSSRDELSFSDLELYPVPAAQELRVSFDSKVAVESSTHLSIYTIEGREVIRKEFTTTPIGRNIFDISLKGMETGMYLLKLENGKSTVFTKFLKR